MTNNTWYKTIEVNNCSYKFVRSVVEAYHGRIVAIRDLSILDWLPDQLSLLKDEEKVIYLLEIKTPEIYLVPEAIVITLKRGEASWWEE